VGGKAGNIGKQWKGTAVLTPHKKKAEGERERQEVGRLLGVKVYACMIYV